MRKKVLLAESDPVALVLMTEKLQADGYSVDVVRDGRTCICELSESLPDILIVNEAMPDISGSEILSHIPCQADRGDRPLKVIMLAAEHDLQSARRPNADVDIRYVEKPRWTKELMREVNEG